MAVSISITAIDRNSALLLYVIFVTLHFLLPVSSMASPFPSPSDGGSVRSEERWRKEDDGVALDLAKRLYELEAKSERLEAENRRLVARNLVLEEHFRDYRRSAEEKDELIIALREDNRAKGAKEERSKERYEKLRMDYESADRKWLGEEIKLRNVCWEMEVAKRKIEIELEVAGRAVDGGGKIKAAEREIEGLKASLEARDGTIRALLKKLEIVEREKVKIEVGLRGRVLKLEEDVEKFRSGSQLFQNRGSANLAPKSVDVTHNEPEGETSEAGLLVKDHNRKGLASEPNGTGKGATPAGNDAFINLVEISDDEEDDKQNSYSELKAKPASSEDSSGTNVHDVSIDKGIRVTPKCRTKELKTPIQGGIKRFFSVASPLIPARTKDLTTPTQEGKKHSTSLASPSTVKTPMSHGVSQRRKIEALGCSIEKQDGTKRGKWESQTDGKLWETADRMFIALTASHELCVKSVCALYRKHKCLGAWKHCLGLHGHRGFMPIDESNGVAMGELLTGGDPEGRVTKSVAEFERLNPAGLEKCRTIARRRYKGLFEIYRDDLDPLFSPDVIN